MNIDYTGNTRNYYYNFENTLNIDYYVKEYIYIYIYIYNNSL